MWMFPSWRSCIPKVSPSCLVHPYCSRPCPCSALCLMSLKVRGLLGSHHITPKSNEWVVFALNPKYKEDRYVPQYPRSLALYALNSRKLSLRRKGEEEEEAEDAFPFPFPFPLPLPLTRGLPSPGAPGAPGAPGLVLVFLTLRWFPYGVKLAWRSWCFLLLSPPPCDSNTVKTHASRPTPSA